MGFISTLPIYDKRKFSHMSFTNRPVFPRLSPLVPGCQEYLNPFWMVGAFSDICWHRRVHATFSICFPDCTKQGVFAIQVKIPGRISLFTRLKATNLNILAMYTDNKTVLTPYLTSEDYALCQYIRMTQITFALHSGWVGRSPIRSSSQGTHANVSVRACCVRLIYFRYAPVS